MSARKVLTLAFLRNDSKVLLGMKKRGFGVGKWNGFGGKVEVGETIPEAAAREVKEECGLIVDPDDLEQTGEIEFEFKGDPVLLEVHVFQTRKFAGEVIETDEMKPEWFEESCVPYRKMWLDDEIWYPYLFSNQNFKAYFLFEGHDKMLDHNVQLVNKDNV